MDSDLSTNNFPEIILDTIFKNMELPDLLTCMLVCKYWNNVLKYENTDPWKTICRRMVPEEGLNSELLSKVGSYKAIVRSFVHGWNPEHCTKNFHIQPDGITLLYNPEEAFVVDQVRAKRGYDSGVHVWEIYWNGLEGVVNKISLTKAFILPDCTAFLNDRTSWIADRILEISPTAVLESNETFNQNFGSIRERHNKMRLILDWEQRVWRVQKDNKNLRVYHLNGTRSKLYPTLTLVGRTVHNILESMTIVYVGNELSDS